MMVRHADISHVFSTSGPLARVVDGFRPRPQQREMALGVARAMEGGGALLVEAGTGVGKTFAYLVPALLSGRRVIISTGTRSLQDQLFNRDLPTVSDAVGRPVKVAMLKGRSNYLCQHRLSLAGTEARFASRDEARWFSTIRAWAGMTRTGDVAEVDGVPEKARVWPSPSRGDGRRRRDRQSPSPARRHGAARGRLRTAAPGRRRGDRRRGPPAA
jgi:ATP-dependent DNA helicase DinG